MKKRIKDKFSAVKRKCATALKRFFNSKIVNFILFRCPFVLETFVLCIVAFMQKNKIAMVVLLVLAVVDMVFGVIKHIQVSKSTKHIIDIYRNNRVKGQEGAQGSGKTMYMFYCASIYEKCISNSGVYSVTPVKINGKYVNKLTTQHLELKEQLPEFSLALIDEITLFYHNLDDKNQRQLETYLQCIRHFTDGCFDCSSVQLDRLPKQLREKFSLYQQHLGIGITWNSFILCPIYAFINLLVKDKNNHGIIKYGLIYFDIMEYTPILHEGYNFDLSNTEKNTNDKQFANLYRCYGYFNGFTFEYDDRFLRGLYTDVPIKDDKKWKSLQYDVYSLEMSGFRKLIEYFESVIRGK